MCDFIRGERSKHKKQRKHTQKKIIIKMVYITCINNNRSNVEEIANYKRKIECFAYAPPPVINSEYGMQMKQDTESYITTCIYSKDIVPRLQWASIIKTRTAIFRLLRACNQLSMFFGIFSLFFFVCYYFFFVLCFFCFLEIKT